MSQRARRALPLMAGALAAIVVVGLVYLHPALPARQPVLGAATPPPQRHPLPVTSAKGGLAEGSAPLLGSSVYLLPGHGLLAVADDLNAGRVGLTSFDGGTTWRRLPPPPGSAGYADFVFQDASHWWAMRLGALFKSSDAGMSWKQVSLQLDDWNYLPQVIDAKHAWAKMVGVAPGPGQAPGTGLAVTSDGGLHWTPVQVPVPS